MSTDIIEINELKAISGVTTPIHAETCKQIKVMTLCGNVDTLLVADTRKLVQLDIMEHVPFGNRCCIQLTKTQATILADAIKRCYE
ncbi:MAG: hypothetical protein JKY66_11255 [Spongiibacteraceae bacterium]|nr:hypothetical protein [Spongiibacteraceae bacterium]